jgi:hypothetical protein
MQISTGIKAVRQNNQEMECRAFPEGIGRLQNLATNSGKTALEDDAG